MKDACTPAIATILFFLAALMIGGPTASFAQSQEADRVAIEALMTEFEAAYEARDVERLMATLVDSDDLMLFLPNPYIPMLIDGRRNAREAIGIFMETIPKRAVFIMTRQQPVVKIYGDLAVDYNYTNIYLLVGGNPFNFLARTTNILRKEKGQWRILHIHGAGVPKMSDYQFQ